VLPGGSRCSSCRDRRSTSGDGQQAEPDERSGQVPGSRPICSDLGLLIALVLRRFARRPRTAWIRITVALTVVSLVPDVLADAAIATKVLLMVTHVVAAVVVIPAVARRLRA
jgi:hypothetical protein